MRRRSAAAIACRAVSAIARTTIAHTGGPERAAPRRSVTHTGGPERAAPRRSVTHTGGPERAAPRRSVTHTGGSERAAPRRSVTHTGGSERAAPRRSVTHTGGPEKAAPRRSVTRIGCRAALSGPPTRLQRKHLRIDSARAVTDLVDVHAELIEKRQMQIRERHVLEADVPSALQMSRAAASENHRDV